MRNVPTAGGPMRHYTYGGRTMSEFVPQHHGFDSGKPEDRRRRALKLKPLPKPGRAAKRGPLTGTRVLIVHDHPRHGLTATLTHRYMKCGGYYAPLDSEVHGQHWETVVRPHEWRLIA